MRRARDGLRVVKRTASNRSLHRIAQQRSQFPNPKDEAANRVVSINRYGICNHWLLQLDYEGYFLKNEQKVERLSKVWIGWNGLFDPIVKLASFSSSDGPSGRR